MGYEIKLKSFNRLDELSARLIVPLRDAAVRLSQRIQTRVRKGIGPTGTKWQSLGTYKSSGRSNDPRERWWVAPGMPTPGGYLRRVDSGNLKGWTVYENYDEYIRALPNGYDRTWTRTGSMWRSMGVRAMSVDRVKVSFYGTKGRQYGYVSAGGASMRRLGQAQVASLAGRGERFSVLQPSDEEKRLCLEEIWAEVNEELAARIGDVAEAGRINRRVRLAQRRAARTLGG